jgi:hypothetical protein
LIPQLLVGEGEDNPKISQYRRNFIRLTDKAISEYHEVRDLLTADVRETNATTKELKKTGLHFYMVAIVNHIENCINAISRLYKLLVRINSGKESEVFPRQLFKLLNTKYDMVKSLRDSIEHIDEQIQSDEITTGKPIMLTINEAGNGIAISNFEMSCQNLASVLTHMNEIAQYLLSLKTPMSQNTSPSKETR